MEKKKILVIASTPLKDDGLTKIEMDVIRYNKSIIDFEVACGFGFDNKYGEELKNKGIKCIALPKKKDVFRYMQSIKKVVSKGKYDSVYIHGNSAMMFLEAIPSKIGGSRVITHCHNTKSKYPLVHYLMKPIFNISVDVKVACSSFAAKWAYFGKRIKIIVNGVRVDQFRFNPKIRSHVRREFNWEDKKIIGHIGRFTYQKNHLRLLEIFNTMYLKDDDCRLLLIGDGELSSEIKQKILELNLNSVVKIISHTDKPQDYMQAMDVMIIPSLFEGLCLVAVEAQASGLPVLIDTRFSPETTASKLAISLNLSQTNDEWANVALVMIKNGRYDVCEEIINKRMDWKDMMIQIQEVLVD